MDDYELIVLIFGFVVPVAYYGFNFMSFFTIFVVVLIFIVVRDSMKKKDEVFDNFVRYTYDKVVFRAALEQAKKQTAVDGASRVVVDPFGNLFLVEKNYYGVVVKKYKKVRRNVIRVQ